MKYFVVVLALFALAVAEPEAEAEAEAEADPYWYYNNYGYHGYRHPYQYNYGYPHYGYAGHYAPYQYVLPKGPGVKVEVPEVKKVEVKTAPLTYTLPYYGHALNYGYHPVTYAGYNYPRYYANSGGAVHVVKREAETDPKSWYRGYSPYAYNYGYNYPYNTYSNYYRGGYHGYAGYGTGHYGYWK